KVVPKGFIPDQDQGYLLVNVQLPDAASVQRTQKVMETIQRLALGDDVYFFDLKNDTRVRGRILREGKAGELGLKQFSPNVEGLGVGPAEGAEGGAPPRKPREKEFGKNLPGPAAARRRQTLRRHPRRRQHRLRRRTVLCPQRRRVELRLVLRDDGAVREAR